MLFGHVAAVMFKLTEKRRKAAKGMAAADPSNRNGDDRAKDKSEKR